MRTTYTSYEIKLFDLIYSFLTEIT